MVFCRIWRWPDLQNCNELKSVPHCQHAYSHTTNMSSKKPDDSQLVCINPYHYLRCNSNDPTAAHAYNNSQGASNLLTVYVPVNSSATGSNDLTTIAEDEATNSTLSSTASTPISYSHSPQQHQMATHISSSSSTSSYSSLQNDIVIPQLSSSSNFNSNNTNNNSNNLTSAAGMHISSDLMNSNYMPITSPPQTDHQVLSNHAESANMINYFMRSNSPQSPLGSSLASNFNMNSQSPISASPMSNSNALQQFSPFISEDDSSEINDISPSPIGSCGKNF